MIQAILNHPFLFYKNDLSGHKKKKAIREATEPLLITLLTNLIKTNYKLSIIVPKK
jgi:hypothetical protein